MPTPTITRLQEVISKVREDLLEEAFSAVLARYRLNANRISLPLIRYSDECLMSPYTGRTCSGSTDMKSVTLYSRGILERVHFGGYYELVALNAYIHERVHLLAEERTMHERRLRIHDMQAWAHVRVGGFRVLCTFGLPEGFRGKSTTIRSGTSLDEGVTELLAREVMSTYLAMDPRFAHSTEERIREHRGGWRAGAEFTFYSLAVRFVHTLVGVLSLRHGSQRTEWESLYRDYFIGTNVLVEPSWKRRLDECGIESMVHKALGCEYAELASIETALRENFL